MDTDVSNRTSKLCPKCKDVKHLNDFYKNSSTGDGLQSYCKKCQTLVNAGRDKEKTAARNSRWKSENPNRTAATRSKSKQKLMPGYVANLLGVHASVLTPDLYKLKREQILNHRALKELTTTLKELTHEE